MTTDLDDASAQVDRTQWVESEATARPDRLAREEPLEIRIGGVPIAVVMRTPGDDLDLVRGFLLTERIVDAPADIATLAHCTTVAEPEAEDNVVLATLREGISVDLARLRRNLFTSSSCGLCGKATIDAALAHAPALHDDVRIASNVLYGLPDALRQAQAGFAATGGVHAAGLFMLDGSPIVVREDVGRHNAVDKAIGAAVTCRVWPLAASALMVSGRVSYEIVQKALAARIPIVAAVSAPTTLAVDLATRAGITLVAFLRGRSASVYAGAERVG